MSDEPVVVVTQASTIAAVRVTTEIARWPQQFRHELDKVYEAVKAGAVPRGGRNVMVYRSRHDGKVDIDCGIEVASLFEPSGEVVCTTLPAGRAITVTHIGPYTELGQSHRLICEWSDASGH